MSWRTDAKMPQSNTGAMPQMLTSVYFTFHSDRLAGLPRLSSQTSSMVKLFISRATNTDMDLTFNNIYVDHLSVEVPMWIILSLLKGFSDMLSGYYSGLSWSEDEVLETDSFSW
jgi:hypothetical protein